MTKKQCLEMTAALWDWLAENPDKGKFQWPGWPDTGVTESQIDAHNECPCCIYTACDCSMCPVPWPEDPDSPADSDPCCRYNGPYVRWIDHNSTRQQRTDAAREVAALARSQL